MSDNIGIKIDGNVQLADALEGLILNILNTSAGDSVKETALGVLKEAFPYPKNVSISNAHVQMPEQKVSGYACGSTGCNEEIDEDNLDEDNLDEEEDY